jgi:hypothetical protein
MKRVDHNGIIYRQFGHQPALVFWIIVVSSGDAPGG